MTTTIQPDRMFFGAPASLTVDGVESGTSFDAPKVTIEYTTNADKTMPQGARSKIKGLLFVKSAVCKVVFKVNEWTAVKLGWVMPGATATSAASVGVPVAGLDTTLGADPALGATTFRFASVTTVAAGQFVRVAAAGVAATEANSEVMRVVTKGTAGGTDTVLENSAGGGALLDHANAAEVKTVIGTLLAAPAVAGDVNVKVDAVTGSSALAPGDIVRIGYASHYETRTLTAVGTAGPSGTGISFAVPLTRDHGLDEWVVAVTSLGLTTIQPVAGRVPSSAHHDVILTGIGLDGLPLYVELDDALSLVNQDIAFSDDDWSGFSVELEAYGDPLTPSVLPWRIKYGA
jgi:hypothetical protein